jgi:hypothetical protein
MHANVRSFRFLVRKPFSCVNSANDGDSFMMPKGYIFTAWVKSYQRGGKEYQDFFIFPDGKLLKKKLEIHGVLCDHTKFVEDE